jgi:8-oxo-dGTP diphosphatase
MDEFLDKLGCKVRLVLHPHAFSKKSKHVLVICLYRDQWLLTDNVERGWEFPGGKKEPGETLEEAAIREVYEETGGKINSLYSIAEYEVTSSTSSFIKTVFFATVKELEVKEDYFETNGPIFVEENLLERRFEDSFSFIMKDQVIEKCIELIMNKFIDSEKSSLLKMY